MITSVGGEESRRSPEGVGSFDVVDEDVTQVGVETNGREMMITNVGGEERENTRP